METENRFIVELDAGALIQDFNETACKMSGYSKDEVLGKNWFEVFIPNSNLMEVLDVFTNLLNGNDSYWEFENEITCKDGSQLKMKWENTLLKNNIGNVYGVSSVGIRVN